MMTDDGNDCCRYTSQLRGGVKHKPADVYMSEFSSLAHAVSTCLSWYMTGLNTGPLSDTVQKVADSTAAWQQRE